ncbi:MAG: hypothetical protein ACC656_00505 [Candidatus Heimdallarchaeota archaeon]
MANMFAKAKKKETPKKAKSEKREVILDTSGFNPKFDKIVKLKEEIDIRGAKLKVLLGEVLIEAKTKFVTIFDKEQKYPGSFMLLAPNGTKCMVVPMERYPKVDDDVKVMLEEVYGKEDCPVTTETTFSFEPRLLEKYGEVISEMIENSDDIDQDDKDDLFVATTTMNITKGSIQKLHTLGDGDVQANFDLLQPSFQLKNFTK